MRGALDAVRTEVGKAVVGQDAVLTGLVIACSAAVTCCSKGVPGVAKTLLVRALAAALSLRHHAGPVHPGPDAGRRDRLAGLRRDRRPSSSSARARSSPTCCSPTRSTGRRRRRRRRCSRRWRSGRSPSRATPRPLPEPFLVVATQNPVEYEGTYPLPEAQLDRFLVKLTVAAARPRRRDRRCWPGTPPGSTRATWRRPASGRSPARPTWPRRAAAVRGSGSAPEVARLHRRPVPGHPAVAVAAARRLPARRDRAAGHQPGPGPGWPAATTSRRTT